MTRRFSTPWKDTLYYLLLNTFKTRLKSARRRIGTVYCTAFMTVYQIHM